MTAKRILMVSVAAVSIATTGTATPYDATIGEKEILTPAPKAAPRINGPKIYGARPEKIFLYRIPCQGERPIRFEVTGLPDGLRLDQDKGIISGKTPAKPGDYPVIFEAKNAKGEDSRTFKIVVGDKLALTPPTGWNSWGGHLSNVSDKIMRDATDMIVSSGLADVGYQYVNIDDCWMRMAPEEYAAYSNMVHGTSKDRLAGLPFDQVIAEPRDAKGYAHSNSRFPDMKGLADYVHSYGLKAGLYSSPGIRTCQHFNGSLGYEQQDAEQYARWGFDFLKYDLCSGMAIEHERMKANPNYQRKELFTPMIGYLKAQDRDIFFNLCQYGQGEPWKWAPEIGCQSWRIGNDLNHELANYFKIALRMATELREYSGPGHWNDPDYLYINRIGDAKHQIAKPAEVPLNTNQRYQYATLWAMVCAPMFLSSEVYSMDDFTVRLMGNADVMNINQDELGQVAEVVRNKGNEVVLAKKLVDGSRAVAVFNRNDKDSAVIDIDWETFGECCTRTVYDVWRQKEVGTFDGGLSVKLSPNGVGLFIVRE